MDELMMVGWFNQAPHIIEQETYSTMKRQEIDDTIFKICFLEPISKEADEEFLAIAETHKDYYSTCPARELKKCTQNGKEYWYYDGKIIFEYFVRAFNKNDKTLTKSKFYMFMLICFGYGMSPGIIRVIHNQSFHGENWVAILAFYLNCLGSAYLMMTVFMFFSSAKLDMKRRAFLLRQLGQIISCKKITSYTDFKLLPTINITDQITMNTWLELRKLTVDYGRKYFARHEIFFPVLFLIGMMNLTASFIFFVTKFNLSGYILIEISKMRYLFAMNTILMFFFFFSLLYLGAGINDQFSVHVETLKKNKQIFNDLIFFKEFYFADHDDSQIEENSKSTNENDDKWNIDDMGIEQDDLVVRQNIDTEQQNKKKIVIKKKYLGRNGSKADYISSISENDQVKIISSEALVDTNDLIMPSYDFSGMKNKMSASYVHKKLAQEIKSSLGCGKEKYSGQYVGKIQKINEAVIEEMDDLEKYKGMKVLGFSMTYSNINSSIFALISITLTAYEIFSQ